MGCGSSDPHWAPGHSLCWPSPKPPAGKMAYSAAPFATFITMPKWNRLVVCEAPIAPVTLGSVSIQTAPVVFMICSLYASRQVSKVSSNALLHKEHENIFQYQAFPTLMVPSRRHLYTFNNNSRNWKRPLLCFTVKAVLYKGHHTRTFDEISGELRCKTDGHLEYA